MHQAVLNDAALALSRILTFHRIHHGFFGGFAILAKGARYRESKDLDVLVSAPKPTITSILSAKRGWLEIPQVREDYVAYFWDRGEYCDGDRSGDAERNSCMVLVEMFLGEYQGSRFPVATKNQVLRGTAMGTSYVPILAEEYLLRGKLNAAATRGKQSDLQDIQFLVNTYGKSIGDGARGVDKKTLGLAIKRHPGLRKMLDKVGVQTRGAVWGTRRKKIEGTVQPGMWQVQSALLGMEGMEM